MLKQSYQDHVESCYQMLSGIVHSHGDVQRFFNVSNHTETLNIKLFEILTYVLSYCNTKGLIHKNTIYQIQESLMDRLGLYPLVMFSIYIQHISMLDGVPLHRTRT